MLLVNNQKTFLPGQLYSTYAHLRGVVESVDMLCKIGEQRAADESNFGYCLTSAEALDMMAVLLRGKKVLDAGSGSGWLANELVTRNIDVLACDARDYRLCSPARPVFRLDYEGDAVSLLPDNFDVVILSWPSYGSDFARLVIQAMKPGQMLMYLGEVAGGSCATLEFFIEMKAMFNHFATPSRLLNARHVSFPHISDQWWIGEKVSY